MSYLLDPDLSGRRMIWIAGPRPAGKTSLAKEHLRLHRCEHLNYDWDDPVIRRK